MYIRVSESRSQLHRVVVEKFYSMTRYVRAMFWHFVKKICVSTVGCRKREGYRTRTSQHIVPDSPTVDQLLLDFKDSNQADNHQSILEALDSAQSAYHRQDGDDYDEELSHRQPCFEYEEAEARCLNDGVCFALELHNGIRRAACSCGPEWRGERCELKYIDPIYWSDPEEHVKRAAVHPAVAALIVIFFLFMSATHAQKWFEKRRHGSTRRLRCRQSNQRLSTSTDATCCAATSSKYLIDQTAYGISFNRSLDISEDILQIIANREDFRCHPCSRTRHHPRRHLGHHNPQHHLQHHANTSSPHQYRHPAKMTLPYLSDYEDVETCCWDTGNMVEECYTSNDNNFSGAGIQHCYRKRNGFFRLINNSTNTSASKEPC